MQLCHYRNIIREVNICTNTLEQIHKSYIKHLINTKIHICPLQDEYEEARSNKGTMSFSVLSNEFSLMTNIMRRNETKMKPNCHLEEQREDERHVPFHTWAAGQIKSIQKKKKEGNGQQKRWLPFDQKKISRCFIPLIYFCCAC